MASISRSDVRGPGAPGSTSSMGRNSDPKNIPATPSPDGTGSPFLDFLVDQTEKYYENDFKYDTFTMPDGTVLTNPYKLSMSEWEFYRGYINGDLYILPNERRAAEAAYNKYLQYQSWWEQQQNTYFATDYNSEQSQVERYSEAGLNADLLGIGSSQATSAPGTSPLPVQVGAGQSDFASLTSSIAGVLGIVSSAVDIGSQIVGVMAGITGLSQAKEDLKSSQLKNAGSIVSLVDSLYDFMPDSFFEKQIDDVGDIDAQTKILQSSIMSVASGLGLDEKTTAAVDNFLRSPSSSSILKRWKNRYEAEVQRQSYYWNREDPYRFTPNNEDFNAIRKYDADLRRFELEFDIAKTNYDKAVVQGRDASLESSMMNAKNEADAMDAQVRKAGKQIIDKYLSHLTSMALSGSGFGQAAASLAYQTMLNGGNMSLAGALSILAPYTFEILDEIMRICDDPVNTLPDEVKKSLSGSIPVAQADSILFDYYSKHFTLKDVTY